MSGYESPERRRLTGRCRSGPTRGAESDARRAAGAVLAGGGDRAVCCSSRCCADILLPFVAGIVIAYFLNPAADRLDAMGRAARRRRGAHRRRLRLPSSSSRSIFAGAAAARPGAAVRRRPARRDRAPAGRSSRRWARERLGPTFPSSRRASTAARDQSPRTGRRWPASSPARCGAAACALFNFLSLLLITPLVVFYLLVDWHPMLAKIDSWLPRDHAPTIRRLAGEINDAVSAFIRGQGTVCLMLGVYYALALSCGRPALWPAGRPRHRPAELHAVRRLGARPHHRDQPRHRAVLAGRGADRSRWSACFVGGQALDAGVPVAADRRLEDRPASGVADLRAVRVQLSVRLRRHAGRGAARRGDRRAGALRAAASISTAPSIEGSELAGESCAQAERRHRCRSQRDIRT